ncbi:MAG: flavodoxin-dependent (E)-4-hydroxy-3-methylbut-2-enyl-diphosphate synthase [Candidatus Caldatribacteriota bacterium]|jgi:(E)-4-hydroxy-3-methylbut-2-enyl-diphosphate synthase|nr:flavodoxin-dependent (E)-4-hydroxy-3-methylbut-2-enyl-diphosphate synthase [Atribacterota bacterium]MDD5635248.1 flavodoxin-dependent (E)-4-hydroxy-3-methylbut-2-enyl-diphosphate synthase [Atribacterota bacterium]
MINNIVRRKSIVAKIGSLKIGGHYPISVQSMTDCSIKETEKTINQIRQLEKAGCELIRIAFPDIESCKLIPIIKNNTKMPIMADIHFNPSIAIEAIKNNIDGIRINPGNIKKKESILQIIEEAKKKNIMIRFGVNSGSLSKKTLEKFNLPDYKAMVEETNYIINFLNEIDYHNIVLSIKSSDIIDTIEANRIIAKKCDYPLHIGITEAGFGRKGIVKSAVGIGILLYEGIGDTVRVSLSGNPEQEVLAGYDILGALGLRKRGINIISCPTCGRCQVDIHEIGKLIESRLKDISDSFTIAIMGCVVNGPGEAKFSDIGIAFNKKEAMLYKKGKFIGRFNTNEAVDVLVKEIRLMSNNSKKI